MSDKVYKLFWKSNGKFSHAINLTDGGETSYVRNEDGTHYFKYDPSTHTKAAEFLATNPNLSDINPVIDKPIINWTNIINGLLTNSAFWSIFSTYEGLNLSPKKRLTARSTELMLLRLPELQSSFIASWNEIVTAIRSNILATKPTPAEISSMNSILTTNNAPFKFNDSTALIE